MGRKCKIMMIIAVILLLGLMYMLIKKEFVKNDNKYNEKIHAIFNDKDYVKVQDIFSFQFHRAYILSDPYLSGKGFSERYKLDLSIEQVKSGTSENVQRIVFVDENGKFVYEFQCKKEDIFFVEQGIVIYPETIVERQSDINEKTLKISFKSTESYLYF